MSDEKYDLTEQEAEELERIREEYDKLQKELDAEINVEEAQRAGFFAKMSLDDPRSAKLRRVCELMSRRMSLTRAKQFKACECSTMEMRGDCRKCGERESILVMAQKDCDHNLVRIAISCSTDGCEAGMSFYLSFNDAKHILGYVREHFVDNVRFGGETCD